jgi:short-subunit dehydrogenase
MTRIADQVVWITGASSGIGEALALEMARRGAVLILSARREDELRRVQDACRRLTERPVDVVVLDLADRERLAERARQAEAIHGRVDILVNNGGVSQRGHVWENDTELVDRRLFEVNFFGAIELSKRVLPGQMQRRHGHHVVISSTTGRVGTPLRTAYAASKHALHGFYDSMRAEVHDYGIKVTIIAPGFVNTPITLSALRPDGTPLNVMGEAQKAGIPTDVLARKIVRAIESDAREQHIAGAKEHLGWLLSRFWPGLLARMVRRVKST